MKAYGGVDISTHIFLTLALAWGEQSASRPGCFTPGERVPGTHWIGPHSRSRQHEEDKILDLTRTQIPTPQLSSL
jgi:hypothetical protein